MATHSSILAWRIQWTEEPGKLRVHGDTKSPTGLSDFTFTVCPALGRQLRRSQAGKPSEDRFHIYIQNKQTFYHSPKDNRL